MILGAMFIALGCVFIATSSPKRLRNETWMEQHLPKKFGKYFMRLGEVGPEATYKMDKYTYDTLKPYGIVARTFRKDEGGIYKDFDAVVIMSNQKESFHDPRVCFTAQGWRLASETTETVNTKTHGAIPVTLTEMQMQGTGRKSFAAFFYKGPDGFCSGTSALKMQMLKRQMFKLSDAEGAFYRIIPMYDAATKQDLLKFIDEFLAATNKTSNGLL